MSANFKDLRLIEAFDYIDPKYIAEVGESLKLRSVQDKEYVKPTFGKHVKQIALLVGCLLLLSCAFPVFNYVLEVVNSMAAGWGSVCEETTDDLNTHLTEPLNSDPYSINQAELDQINAAWAKYTHNSDTIYCTKPEDIHYLSGGQYRFYGKYNGCIILFHTEVTCVYNEFEVNGNLFRIPSGVLWVSRYGEPYSLTSAYENGWLSDEDVEEICEQYNDSVWGHLN